jgi:hypothetical protein
MILGIEDIAGGTTIVAFLIWLFLSGLFYMVCFIAVLNTLDSLTGNHWLKIPAMLGAAFPSAGLMLILNYQPLVLAVVMGIANIYRVKKIARSSGDDSGGKQINLPLHYLASYCYIALVPGLEGWFQQWSAAL